MTDAVSDETAAGDTDTVEEVPGRDPRRLLCTRVVHAGKQHEAAMCRIVSVWIRQSVIQAGAHAGSAIASNLEDKVSSASARNGYGKGLALTLRSRFEVLRGWQSSWPQLGSKEGHPT